MKPIHQAASVLTCVIVASTLILRAPLPATAQTIGVINRTEPIVLTVAPSYMRHHEEHSVVTASLMTEVGKPLANAEMLLRVDNFLELRARTDAQGIATFELPGELLEGGYDLRFRFVGNPNWQPATATSQLTMQPPLTPGLADVDANGAMTAVQRANIDVDVADAPANAPRGMVQVVGEPVALALLSPEVLPRGSVIPVRLTSLNGIEIGNAPVVLFVDHALEIDGMTDANGDARFQLPPELLEGDYRIRVVFTGKDEYGPAMQLAALRLHPASAHDTLPRPADANALTHLSAAAPALLSGISDWFVGVSATLPVWVKASLDPAEIVYLPAQSPASAPAPLNHRANGQDALAARQDVATSTHASRLMRESKTEAPSTDAPITPSPPGAGVTWAPGMVTWLAAVTGGLSLPAIAILLAIMTIGLVVSPAVMGRWRRAAPRRRAGWTGRSFSIPMPVWYVLRICSVGIALGTAVVLIVRPALGLRVFWGAFIPMVPLLFFVAPGLWRNICPMAALNQTPRMFKFSRGLTLPRWWQEYSFVIAVGLFLVLAASRKVIFNQNGPALALLILAALGTALLMGSLYKGKSGWCSSICPLLPVQRVYGQTPFVSVPHAHCQPCLGCTKNCYDLSPKYALLADFHDPEPQFAAYRKVFVGLFPGFILGFFLAPNPPDVVAWQTFAVMTFTSLVSLGSYFLLESLTKVSDNKISVLYGAIALNTFYWFNAVTLGKLISTPPPDWFVWSLRALVLGLTLIWLDRTFRKEATYFELALAPATQHEAPSQVMAGAKSATVAHPVVTVEPEGKRITVEKNKTLLEICESHGLPIEAGCRMGLCGADPVCIKAGMENLSKLGAEEKTTLERLGLGPHTRMACMARVRGDVKVALTPEKPDVYRSSIVAGFKYDAEVKRVVIVGNGIAGVTAADHIRRRHPKCEIHLIGRERHHLYNRMGITRLIYGRSAMQGLYLLPDQWYEDFNITCWLNTHVTRVDPTNRTVVLGTGESLPYDRLILTTGSQSFLPPIEGFGMPGSFVLRTAEDAMAIRAYVQKHGVQRAVVAGGGLLGLEAAYGLLKLGLEVTVLERSAALLTRQLDGRGAEILRNNLAQMGLHMLMEAEVANMAAGSSKAALEKVTLADGRELACDLLLVAAGIRPDLELAREIGLSVAQGVLVDEQMRTSDPHVFAAGDVAEYATKVYGLWPVAVSQAEVAANNAVAAPDAPAATYTETPPVTLLKVVGIDLTSVGRIQVQPEQDAVIALEDGEAQRYRKLIVNGGKIAGAILLGYPEDAPGVIAALKQQVDVSMQMDELRVGDWQFLSQLA